MTISPPETRLDADYADLHALHRATGGFHADDSDTALLDDLWRALQAVGAAARLGLPEENISQFITELGSGDTRWLLRLTHQARGTKLHPHALAAVGLSLEQADPDIDRTVNALSLAVRMLEAAGRVRPGDAADLAMRELRSVNKSEKDPWLAQEAICIASQHTRGFTLLALAQLAADTDHRRSLNRP